MKGVVINIEQMERPVQLCVQVTGAIGDALRYFV